MHLPLGARDGSPLGGHAAWVRLLGIVLAMVLGCLLPLATAMAGGTASATALSASVTSSTYGHVVAFTATVTPTSPMPTGTVTFNDGATALGNANVDANGKALFLTSTLAVGSHSITAAYSGDTTYATSTSSAVSVTVNAQASGTLWSWGENDYGEMGVGSASPTQQTTPVHTNVTGVVAGSTGDHNSIVLTSGGNVYTWGTNGNGELGNGTSGGCTDPCAATMTPVEVVKGACTACSGTYLDHIVAVDQGQFTMIALRDDGTVWMWGQNNDGQLGNNTLTNASSPVEVLTGACGTSCGTYLSGIVAITTTGHTPMGLRYDGTIWAWGYDNYGQFGNNTTNTSSVANTPVEVQNTSNTGPLTGIVGIGAGGGSEYAITSAGAELAWGRGDYGQVGNGGTTLSNPLPTQIIASGVVQVTGAGYTGYAVLSNGTVDAWGDNGFGELANGTSCGTDPCLGTSTPTAISGLSGVSKLVGGWNAAFVLTTSGQVEGWGLNSDFGELGTGNLTNSYTPVQVDWMPSGMANVFAGNIGDHSMAVGTLTPTVTVSSNVNPAQPSQSVTYTATVSGPASPALSTGTVSFFDGGTAIGGACSGVALNGSHQATCSQTYSAVGTHSITAQYSGDPNYNNSTSATYTENVGSWSIVTSPNAGTASNDLYGVACASSSLCFAVGQQTAGVYYQTLIEEWNGSSWSVIASPNSSTTQNNYLEAVACQSTTQCFAAGYYSNGTVNQTLALQWNGTSWALATTANPGGTTVNNQLYGAACNVSCFVVGSDGTTAQTLVEKWNGSNAFAAVTSSNSSTSTNELRGISCPTSSYCVATGDGAVKSGATFYAQPIDEVWSGGTSFTTMAAATTTATTNYYPRGISCMSSSSCTATGYSNAGTTDQTFAESWNGSAWSVQTIANQNANTNDLYGTACPAAGDCWSVGLYYTGSYNQTLAENWNGSAWAIFPSANVSTTDTESLQAVACISTTYCWAAGSYYNGSNDQTLIELFSTSPPPPSVTSVSPASGPAAGGTSVTITGTSFTGASSVKFGGTAAASFTVNSATQVTATSPAGSAGTVDVTVTTSYGTSGTGASDRFTYVAAPGVNSVSLARGPTAGGGFVIITGTNLTGATSVKFGTVAATGVTVQSATSITATVPVATSPGTVDVTVTTSGGTSATSAGDRFTYYHGGGASDWGNNDYGELGNGTTCTGSPCSGSTLPITVAVPGTPEIVQVAGGSGHTVALTSTGNVYAWGLGTSGQLGNNGTASSSTPVEVCAPGGCTSYLSNVVQVVAGETWSAALTSAGNVYVWGSATYGQLGNGTTTQAVLPVEVCAVGGCAGGFLGGIVAISAASWHLDALSGAGHVYAWGDGSHGELGDGSNCGTAGDCVGSTTPVEVAVGAETNCTTYLCSITAVAAGGHHTVALTAGGTVYAWGDGAGGPVGDNTATDRATAVQVTGVGGTGTLTGITSIGAGVWHSLAIDGSGTVYCWGWNNKGYCGNNTTTQENAPVNTLNSAGTGNLTGIVSVAGGYYDTIALTSGGNVYTFGDSTDGQIGDGANTERNLPVEVHNVGGTGYLSNVGETGSGYYHEGVTIALPVISAVSPTSGPAAGGTAVTITGIGFTNATGVTFGGTTAAFSVTSDTQISATSPAGTAGVVDIRVTTPGGTSPVSTADQFTYVAAAPTVTSLSPTGGPTTGGTSVIITGTNFTGATGVSFGATAATSFTVNSATQITATSPAASAGTVDVTVTTGGGTSALNASDQYTYSCSGGSLSVTAPPSVTYPVLTLNGSNQTQTIAVGLTPSDMTGSGSGWHVSATSTTFSNGTQTLPNTAVTITGVQSVSAASGNCNLPSNVETYPIGLPAAATPPTAVPIFDANTATGEGPATVNMNFQIAVPASSYTGTYTSTWTFTISTGP